MRYSTKEPHPPRDGWPNHAHCVVRSEIVWVIVAKQGKVEHDHEPACEGEEVGSHPSGDELGGGEGSEVGGTVGEGGGLVEARGQARDRGCQVRSEVTVRIERWHRTKEKEKSVEKG